MSCWVYVIFTSKLQSVADIFLHRYRSKQAEQITHAIKAFFRAGHGGIPQTHCQQHDGTYQTKPTNAQINFGYRYLFESISHCFLQGNGCKQTK